ncbi:DUF4956 domain-containing protein [Pontibacillus sp. HMF3514]|nr:DUF4956 domain-containing protein [Pontibacillus sp. HMF3514]
MQDSYNFNDIFKKNFLNIEAFSNISIIGVCVTLFVSLLIGLFIFWIYRKTFNGVVYSHNFNVTLVLMTMITSLIIMTISTNIVLSLGMVGALSIVRFRTAIKDPLDIVFMFWAISVGIASGAKIFEVAVVGSLIIGGVVFLFSRKRSKPYTYLLIVHYEIEAYFEIKQRLKKMNYAIKSKVVRQEVTELTLELKLKDDNTSFVNDIADIPGVKDISLVHYNGDYAA